MLGGTNVAVMKRVPPGKIICSYTCTTIVTLQSINNAVPINNLSNFEYARTACTTGMG